MRKPDDVKELYRTNNPVEITYILHELREHGIQAVELDRHASMVEGSIGAIQRRIMVADDDFIQAEKLLARLDL